MPWMIIVATIPVGLVGLLAGTAQAMQETNHHETRDTPEPFRRLNKNFDVVFHVVPLVLGVRP